MMRTRHKPEITARSFDELPHTLVLAEVASLCSMTYAGAHYWITQGWLPARKACGTWLIEKNALLTFVKKRKIHLTFVKIERAF